MEWFLLIGGSLATAIPIAVACGYRHDCKVAEDALTAAQARCVRTEVREGDARVSLNIWRSDHRALKADHKLLLRQLEEAQQFSLHRMDALGVERRKSDALIQDCVNIGKKFDALRYNHATVLAQATALQAKYDGLCGDHIKLRVAMTRLNAKARDNAFSFGSNVSECEATLKTTGGFL